MELNEMLFLFGFGLKEREWERGKVQTGLAKCLHNIYNNVRLTARVQVMSSGEWVSVLRYQEQKASKLDKKRKYSKNI